MADGKNFFLMYGDCPWAGPTVRVIDAPDVNAISGRIVGKVDKPYILELVVENDAPADEAFPPLDLHQAGKFKLFSRRLVSLMQSVGVDNIEYLPAKVIYKPTGESLEYAVANIVGAISAVDEAQSDISYTPSGIVGNINKMVLDESAMQGHKIFILKETVLDVVVSRTVKEAIEAAGMTGFMFVSDDEYEPGMI